MKKNIVVIAGVALIAAASSAVTSGIVTRLNQNNNEPTTTIVERAPLTPNIYTSATKEQSYPDLTYAAEKAVKAVVSIEVTKKLSSQQNIDPFFFFFGIPEGMGGQRETQAGGSGVIITSDGYVVTNNHVIEGASTVKVKLADGRAFDGKVIGSDPSTDVALLKIEAKDLPTLSFGSSDDLRLGEWVLAIGYPMGLQSTVTAGIVSAKARSLGAIDNRYGIESFIQTDAAVNPGNSGGALVNARGELIGINTIIKTSTGSYVGYSFAVPETIVRKVVVDLKESGVVQRAVLGVSFTAIDQRFIDEMGEETGIKDIGGVYVASVVEDGSAAKAGIRKGDVIRLIDGVEINDSATLLEQIGKRRPGDKIDVEIVRNGKRQTIGVTLQNKTGETKLLSREDVDVSALLGGNFQTASTKLCNELDIRGGVQVTKVAANGLMQRARIKEGFIITHINDRAILSVDDLDRLSGKISSIDGIYPNGRAASYMIVE
ncbi:MAG: trypsin-like peptidase domain-containing protein [Alistipes sp.]|nr:trypsin-like peptidase domain-containing protein [Alistipes sp.]